MRLAGVVFLGGLLLGCAATKEIVEQTPAPSPVKLAKWVMDGRIGVHSSNDSWQANLVWGHDERQDRLRLSGPLSQGLITIIVQKDLIYINEGDGVEHLAREPEAALRAKLGFSVPLRSLRYWVLGVPNPEVSWQVVSPETRGAFEQEGWRVTPSGRSAMGEYSLPERLLVEGSGIRLKIVVDQWGPG